MFERCLRGGRWKRLWTETEVVQRFDEHPLAASDCSNGLQPALADPVVDGAARYVQEDGGLIDRDAASESGLESVYSRAFGDCIHGLFVPPVWLSQWQERCHPRPQSALLFNAFHGNNLGVRRVLRTRSCR